MHDLFRAHDPGPHFERPARYDAVAEAVAGSGAEVVEAPAAPLEAVERVHPGPYVQLLSKLCEAGGASSTSEPEPATASLTTS